MVIAVSCFITLPETPDRDLYKVEESVILFFGDSKKRYSHELLTMLHKLRSITYEMPTSTENMDDIMDK